jgi:hypothetical protein
MNDLAASGGESDPEEIESPASHSRDHCDLATIPGDRREDSEMTRRMPDAFYPTAGSTRGKIVS